MDNISKLIESNDTHLLNRLVATSKIDTKNIISKHIDITPVLYVTKSELHGFGVFTEHLLKIGQLIETVYIIELDFTSRYHKDQTIIDYCYAFPSESDNTKKHGPKLYMFTGLGMLYNHNNSNKCNAKWLWDVPNKQAKLVCIKTIQPKEEITIDYGQGYWQRSIL
jgi:hypothetical protein